MDNGKARLSKDHGVNNYGCPVECSIDSRGCIGKGETQSSIGPDASPCLGVGRRTTTKKRKNGKTETTGRNSINTSSLRYLEDWDFLDSSKGLAKLQHKLQQTVQRADTKVGSDCGGTRRSRMPMRGVFYVNGVE